ncbi:MAG TPA: trypsin-like peptidase domain-containing protein, partial [Opitutaceae bacterium]|nr:trypsin-like peptidase domain-containing protein [Opitutaceae bacterium]
SRGEPAAALAQARPPAPRADLGAGEKHRIELFENASRSVVYITTLAVQQDLFSRNVGEIPVGAGSGFVWDDAGHIITNYHVIQNADVARVTLADRSTWEARLVGVAPEKDLAVLRIEAPKASLHPIPVGESASLRVGQDVLAIGNPFGLDQTLTTGVISALGREIESLARLPIRNCIQTDAAINPGNSGGPLLDSAGRLVGVNTQIYSPSGGSAGIGFAIPVDEVNWVVPDLIQHGRLRRPTLGVSLAEPATERRIGIDGSLILEIVRNSGAAQAGLRPTRRSRFGQIELGDVIIGIDGTRVRSSADVPLLLERRQPGETVTLKVRRGRDEIEVPVTLSAPR